MLIELGVRDLGVIAELRLAFGPGMTALTGETGAGKTMVVEAIGLLLGGRADAARVRPGAAEAVVEGLFVVDDEEIVLRRVVPAEGRSRSYVDGQLATSARLAELGGRFVEVHGQHAQQWLTRPAGQRAALDRAGGIDLAPMHTARERVRELSEALGSLGGDERSRTRELDVLRYQASELEAAALDDPGEEVALAAEEDLLADAVAHREAAAAALAGLRGEGGVLDRLAEVRAALDARAPFAGPAARLAALAAEADDAASDVRALAESVEENPGRLSEVRARRQLLVDLRRKYGDTLEAVIAERDAIGERILALERHDERAAEVALELEAARAGLAEREAEVAGARAQAARRLARSLEGLAAEVALDGARVEIATGGVAGADVEIRVATNRGLAPGPLARVASGGELSRLMLAVHLALSAGPPTMVFDEVDAGLGGATATRVGRALARIATAHQVLVVTHLPQVAAFADHQLAVHKDDDGRATTTTVRPLDDDDRVVELSRMLSGSPGSEAARVHAGELLAIAAAERAEVRT